MGSLRGLLDSFSHIMETRTGVKVDLLRALDSLLLDQVFPPWHLCFPTQINSGLLGQSPAQQFRHPFALMVPICQLCNSEGHTALFCGASPPKRTRCNICGRSNHTCWYCFYNDKGPNYITLYSLRSSFSLQPQSLQYPSYPTPSSQNKEVHQSPMQVMQQYTPYQASSSQNQEVQQSPMQVIREF